jgi:hypothetical protein
MVNSENLLRRLRATLDRPDTVLLIGSGVSLWSGLPTWEKLLIQLAEYIEGLGRDAVAVRQEINNGDLLLAASYAVHQLDLREFGAFIRQAIKYPKAKPAEIHRLISSLHEEAYWRSRTFVQAPGFDGRLRYRRFIQNVPRQAHRANFENIKRRR